jgi:hypothetical protein
MTYSTDKDFYGYVIKKEQLESVNNCSDCNAFTLTAVNPFPGNPNPVNRTLFYLIIANKKLDLNEFLLRTTQNINRTNSKKIDASPCEITIYNKFYKAIRLFNHKAEELPEIENLYKLYGIDFLKKQEVKPFISLIKVHKYFELIEIKPTIYQSKKDAHFIYIKIPFELEWEDFEQIVSKAKENGTYKNCDFAIAVFYSKDGFDDFIRVFSDQCEPEKQSQFQTYLLESIKTLTLK